MKKNNIRLAPQQTDTTLLLKTCLDQNNYEKIKEKLYIRYVRPVLSYVSCLFGNYERERKKLLRFEIKKIKMHALVYNHEEQKWKIRANNQLSVLYKRENVVQLVKILD